jgi:hypothetical protein
MLVSCVVHIMTLVVLICAICVTLPQRGRADEAKFSRPEETTNRISVTDHTDHDLKGSFVFSTGLHRLEGDIAKYICDRRDVGSGGIPLGKFCDYWPSYEAIISAAGSAMGYPSQLIACILHIETKVRQGRCSHEGACGLAQYRLPTALDAEAAMKKTDEYKRDWDSFRKEMAKPAYVSRFNHQNIRALKGNVDVQTFAVAFYFRHFVGQHEARWKVLIAKDAKNLHRYYEFLAISYNAGPKAGEKYLDEIENNLVASIKPKETQRYIPILNKCLGLEPEDEGLGRRECRLLGKQPSGARYSCEDLKNLAAKAKAAKLAESENRDTQAQSHTQADSAPSGVVREANATPESTLSEVKLEPAPKPKPRPKPKPTPTQKPTPTSKPKSELDEKIESILKANPKNPKPDSKQKTPLRVPRR